VEAATWTVIAILGASVLRSYAAVFRLGSSLGARIDGLDSRLSSRLDVLTARLDEHIRPAG
jgi:hypothetical protein